jgi:DNA repair photolyase
MHTYDYAISLTSQFYFCGIPFRLDTSPKCSTNCRYCFAMTRGGRRTSRSLIIDTVKLRKKIEKQLLKDALNLDINGQLLKKGMPLHFGGMSDPFSNKITTKKSLEMLQFLADYEIPTILSTKNTDVLSHDKTLKILERMKNIAIQVSFSSSNEKISSLIEPNSPTPLKRLDALKIISSLGKNPIIRLQPLLPSQIKENVENLIPLAASNGVKHVVVEFLKLPVEKNISKMGPFFNAIGWDGYEFYRAKEAKLVGREWLLPLEYKWESLQPLISAIRRNSMTYGSADYGLNHLGDTGCCCGIDNIDGFSNWFRGNISNIIREAPTGFITINNLEKYWYPDSSIKRIINSHSRRNGANEVKDYLIDKWNKPGSINAPDEHLGITWKGDYDENSNCVYYKQKLQ